MRHAAGGTGPDGTGEREGSEWAARWGPGSGGRKNAGTSTGTRARTSQRFLKRGHGHRQHVCVIGGDEPGSDGDEGDSFERFAVSTVDGVARSADTTEGRGKGDENPRIPTTIRHLPSS